MPKKKQIAKEIPLDLINMPETQVRTIELVDGNKIRELAESIKLIGLVEPVVVHPKEGKYGLIAGWRRLMAHVQLGREKILAIVVDVDSKKAALMRFAENEDRDDVHTMDKALHLQEMIEIFDCSQKELAGKIGKSEAFVSQHLALLTGYEEVKQALLENRVSFAIARELNQFKTAKSASFHLYHAIKSGANSDLVKRWRMEAEQFPEEEEKAPGERDEPVVTQQQLNKFVCEGCRTVHDYRTISILRVCPDCFNLIQNAEVPNGK